MSRPIAAVSRAARAAACAAAALLSNGCAGAMSCSYGVLERIAPDATWSDQSTYLPTAMTDWWGTPRVGHWNTDEFPLSVYFAPVPGWNRERSRAAVELVLEGFALWSDSIAPGLPSFRVVDDPRRANLVVNWTPVSLEEDPNLRGETHVGIDRYNRWRGFDIWLLESYVDGDQTQLVRQAAAHELGHALGIAGHSPDPGDLMYPTIEGAPRPSPRDRATLRGLYLCRTKTAWRGGDSSRVTTR